MILKSFLSFSFTRQVQQSLKLLRQVHHNLIYFLFCAWITKLFSGSTFDAGNIPSFCSSLLSINIWQLRRQFSIVSMNEELRRFHLLPGGQIFYLTGLHHFYFCPVCIQFFGNYHWERSHYILTQVRIGRKNSNESIGCNG